VGLLDGRQARHQDIKSPDGDLLAKAGAVRDGGSYEQRMGGIACWNAVMDENEYMVRKWNEFEPAVHGHHGRRATRLL
jgi:putative spermidine/putrescine transport system substrate-binding protein